MRSGPIAFALFALLTTPAMGQMAPSTQDGPLDVKPAPPVPDKNGVYRVGPGIVAPVLTKAVPPQYPPDGDNRIVRHLGFQVVVGVDGTAKLRHERVHDQNPYLDNAIAAVEHSTFQPGTLNGVPVPVAVCVRVTFSPDNPPSTEIADCNPGWLRDRFGSSDLPPSNNDGLGLPPGAKPPIIIHDVVPEFSEQARRERFEGVVTVSTVVNKEGMPTEVRVERSLGHGLDENAVAAVSQYRFRPATLDGKPIAARIRIMISFRLQK
jgi:TonB family protein